MTTPIKPKQWPLFEAILLHLGFEKTGYKKIDNAYQTDTHMIIFHPQRIELYIIIDNDEFWGRNWHMLAEIKCYMDISIDKALAILHAFEMIDYGRLLASAFEMAGLPEKMVVLKINQALKDAASQL